jgi:hypothetical protein
MTGLKNMGEKEETEEADPEWIQLNRSIQEELMILKQDMIQDMRNMEKENIEMGREEKEIMNTDTGEVEEKKEITPDVREDDGAKEERMNKKPLVEPTIKELLGGGDRRTSDHEGKEPARIESGSLPKHPGLSVHIAKVIEHENNVKRRMYERDKIVKKLEGSGVGEDEEDVGSGSRHASGGLPGSSGETGVKNVEEKDFLPNNLGLDSRSGGAKSREKTRSLIKKIDERDGNKESKKDKVSTGSGSNRKKTESHSKRGSTDDGIEGEGDSNPKKRISRVKRIFGFGR